MDAPETIDLYEAIRQMREITQQGGFFSFGHATYNRDTDRCDGLRMVRRASIRPAAKGDDLTHADYKIFYHDHDINLPRIAWQPLIMYFDNKRVILSGS